MGCSKKYIMYWGVFTLIIVSWTQSEVFTILTNFVDFFCAYFTTVSPPFEYNLIFKQRLKLLTGYFFFFQKQLCALFKHVHMLLNHLFGFAIALVNDVLYFRINLGSHLFAIWSGMCQIPADKDFITVVVLINQPQLWWKAVFCNHWPGSFRGLFDILWCPGGNIIKYQFFRNTSA